MSNIVPFGVIHVGLSLALAALLILIYRRLSRADFLLYWALFWIDIALNIGASQIAAPLLSSRPGAAKLLFAFCLSLSGTYAALMLCAALSVRGTLARRTAWRLAAGSFMLGIPHGILHFLSDAPPAFANPVAIVRPILTTLAVFFFAWQLAVSGRREFGESRKGLVLASILYGVHNFLMGFGLYGGSTYSAWGATAGILFEIGLTFFLAWQAIEQANAVSKENARVVTELVKTEAELREREKRLSIIFNAHQDLQSLIRVESDGRFISEAFNRAQFEDARRFIPDPAAYLERSRDEFLRAVGLPESEIERASRFWREAASGKEPVSLRLAFTMGPEKRREIGEFTTVPILNQNGVCTHLLWTGRFVTEQARMEEELRESKRGLEEAQQMARLGSFSSDPDASHLEWSDEMFRLCELDPAHHVPSLQAVFTVAHPEDHQAIREALAGLTATGSMLLKHRMLMPDGRIKHVVVQAALRPDIHGKPGIRGTVQDITEREHAEHERARLEAQLHHAHKMESLGRLAGGVAHDFNNLLTVINGYSVMLAQEIHGPARQYAEQIHRAGESAASLTRQLLAFGRMEVKRPEPVRLNRIVDESRDMLRRLVGDHIRMTTSIQASPDDVLAEASQIQQCLINLVVNARDAMPIGGSVAIETANMRVAPEDLPRGSNASPGRYVRLTVRDTGIGMDDSTRQHIFEPFFTTKEAGSGTGLGLSTVYGIVNQRRGFLKVKSQLSHGSEFSLFLPLNTEARPQPDSPEPDPIAPTNTPAAQARTVLVVEDEHNVRQVVAESLTRCGYTVLQAGNGAEALQIIERNGAGIHLMLTDFRMPGMRGNELAARVKILRPSIKVLFMTGYADSSLNPFAGETQILLKPFAQQALTDRVRELLLS